MTADSALYGLVAEFASPEALVAAARRAHDAGYRRMDAYTPFPVEGLADALGCRHTWVPHIVLAGGVLGCAGGFALQYFAAVINFPWNVGGRPYDSWPAFIPITFELTILSAALCAVVGMLALNGLPLPYHPVFRAPHFDLATQTRFFLCIEASDPRFDPEQTRRLLEGTRPLAVSAVAP